MNGLKKACIATEKNFSFLKDPAIVNSIFLKKAERIEVLGFVLLVSILIWRLMERSMRRYLETNDSALTGWVRRKIKLHYITIDSKEKNSTGDLSAL